MKPRNSSNPRFKTFTKVAAFSIIIGLVLSACSATPTPDPDLMVRQAVKATLAAIPRATTIPTMTPAPTSTPVSISDLFCEYNFCIGHPKDIYLIDQGSTRQPPVTSTYANGTIFGYSSSFFIQVNWKTSDATYNPQSSMHSILTGGESFQGVPDKMTVGNISVSTQPISTVTALLPFGLVATWQCGDRDFVWKIYSPEDGMANDLLKQSMGQFKCQGY